MSASFECRTCNHNFSAKKFNKNLICPFCGSEDIFEKSTEYLISTTLLKKLILTELILIVIILGILIIRQNDGPKISKVEIDKAHQIISVTVKSSSLGRELEYSFNNGKTYQNNKSYYVRQPGTYIIVVRDFKNRKTVWNIPVTFNKDEINHSVDPAIIPPPQITGVEPGNETVQGGNDGRIIIHTINGKKPIKYSLDGGKSFSNDSIFNNLAPGKYNIYIIDDASHIDTWSDPIILTQGITGPEEHITLQTQTRSMIENKLNRLFSEPDNTLLKDSIQKLFINQTMYVECELIDIPPKTPYQLYQFLQRRYEGQPGTKRIQVLDIGYDPLKRINKLKVRETRVSINK